MVSKMTEISAADRRKMMAIFVLFLSFFVFTGAFVTVVAHKAVYLTDLGVMTAASGVLGVGVLIVATLISLFGAAHLMIGFLQLVQRQALRNAGLTPPRDPSPRKLKELPINKESMGNVVKLSLTKRS
jgi:hypothetical protein